MEFHKGISHQLKDILNQAARKPPGLQWSNNVGYRLGNGTLDARATFNELKGYSPKAASDAAGSGHVFRGPKRNGADLASRSADA